MVAQLAMDSTVPASWPRLQRRRLLVLRLAGMKHLRPDYEPIQDPRKGGIAKDEPVFLLRAQDPSAAAAVWAWAQDFEYRGGDPAIVERVRSWAREMVDWSMSHGDGRRIATVPELP